MLKYLTADVISTEKIDKYLLINEQIFINIPAFFDCPNNKG